MHYWKDKNLNKMKKLLLLFIIFSTFFSCKQSKDTNVVIKKNPSHAERISCQLVEKEFTHKGGKFTEFKELYLRCSIQDYFIKICESNVTSEELSLFLNKGIEVEVEIKEGFLDHCESIPEYAQSRTGTYVIIKNIVR